MMETPPSAPELELVPGSFADTGGTILVAKYSLILQSVFLVLFVVLVQTFGVKLPGLGVLAYGVPFFGFIASVSGLLAALIVRRIFWLLVPAVAVAIFVVHLAYILSCCLRWGS